MPPNEVEKTTYLECTTGGSKKFYSVELRKDGSNWSVRAHWGRIGTKGQYQDKGKYSQYWRAENEAKKLIQQKKSKKYVEVKGKSKTGTKVDKRPGKPPPTVKEQSLSRFSDLLE